MSFPRLVPLATVIIVVTIILLFLLGNPLRSPELLHTRYDGIDQFLHTALFQLFENELLKNPLGYYNLPFLYPDPVPIRGTEPLIPLVLLNIPLRVIAVGNAPLAYTLQLLLSMVLLALLSFGMLRTLGVGRILSAMAGISTVALHWWFLFSDRLQMLTLFWLPLVILLFVLWMKSRRIRWLVLFTLALTMLSLTSIYMTLALCFIGIILLPILAIHFWRQRRNRALWQSLIACGVAATLAFVMLLPWLSHRWDDGVYEIKDYLDRREWRIWVVNLLVSDPPELAHTVLTTPTPAERFGSFPGFAVLLFAGAVLWQATRKKRERNSENPGILWLRRIRAIGGWGWGIWALGGAFVLPKTSTPLLLVGDALLWTWLGAWIALLAVLRFHWDKPDERNPWLAEVAAIIALLFMLLTLGSPVYLFSHTSPVANGVFSVASAVLPPFNHARELYRFIIPGGWFLVMALGVSGAGHRLETAGGKVAVPLLVAICVLSILEAWGAEPDQRRVPAIFPEYQLLEHSTGHGGLLELPYFKWVHPHAIRRMYWQPHHGRPIADGYTGFMPAWRAPAKDIYNEFPSAQCLALLRAWNIDTVLAEPAHEMDEKSLPAGVLLRGAMNGWRLYDLELEKLPRFEQPQAPEGSREVKPVIYRAGAVDGERTALLTDGETGFRSIVSLGRTQWMVFHAQEGPLTGVVLDFGYGAFFRMPDEVIVEARIDGTWQRVDDDQCNRFIAARCADLLMNSRFARVFIPLRKVDATVYRLKGDRKRWDLPEMRLVVDGDAGRD